MNFESVALSMEAWNYPANDVKCMFVNIQDGRLDETSSVNTLRTKRDMTNVIVIEF